MSTQEEKLIQKIRDVFDAHEDASADAGWAELRKKYPEKDRRALVFWSSLVTLVIFFAAGLWYLSPTDPGLRKDGKNSVRPDSAVVLQNGSGKLGNSKSIRAKEDMPGNTMPSDALSERMEENHKEKAGGTYENAGPRSIRPLNSLAPRAAVPKLINEQRAMTDHNAGVQDKTKLMAQPSVDSTAKTSMTASPEAQPISVPDVKKLVKSPIADTAGKKETIKSKRRLPLGFYASGYTSYARGSSGRLNGGLGAALDIPLSKSIMLNIGLAISQTHLHFNNGMLPTAPSGKASDQFFSSQLPLPGTIAVSTSSIDVKLLSFDMPVNIKYVFSKSKHRLFMAAGTSTGLFLNEIYMYNNTLINTSPQTNAFSLNTRTERFSEDMSSFNAARSLNFTSGVAYKIGAVETLHIEPFIKLPVAGMGSRHIYYGSAGLNLRLSIGNSLPATNTKR